MMGAPRILQSLARDRIFKSLAFLGRGSGRHAEPRRALVSIIAMAGIYYYVKVREIESRWGDTRSGVLFERARRNLLALEEEKYHPKNWRPNLLALSGAGWQRTNLAVYGHWLTAGHGVLTLGQVIQGDIEDLTERRRRQEDLIRSFIEEEEVQAFSAVVVADYLSDGIESARIKATPHVIVAEDVSAAIQGTSRNAAVAILGFEAPSEGSETSFHKNMERLAGNLPRVLFVDSAGDVELES
ncbi:MAG: hypothetical protein JXM70_04130 [Pirellulales bacterium]|nr:hypothetical protein [Pirellulales bacterium]